MKFIESSELSMYSKMQSVTDGKCQRQIQI